MTNKVILHIGTRKAGSTALQTFFKINREHLAEMGFLYPTSNSSGLAHHAYGHLWGHGPMSEAKRTSLDAEKLWADLSHEADNWGRNLLMSTEAWAVSFSRSPKSILDVREAFKGKKITIVLYIRAQYQHAESWYNQHVKGGFELGDVSDLGRLPLFYNYYDLLNSLSGVFGKENVVVRPYEKKQFLGGSIFKDFVASTGLEWSDKLIMPTKDINPKLTAKVFDFLVSVNRIHSKPLDEKRVFNRFILNNFCDQEKDTPVKILDRSVVEKIVSRYADQNRKVALEYLHREDGILFFDKPDFSSHTYSIEDKPYTAEEMSIKIWEKLKSANPALPMKVLPS